MYLIFARRMYVRAYVNNRDVFHKLLQSRKAKTDLVKCRR